MSRSQWNFAEYFSVERFCGHIMHHAYTALRLPPQDHCMPVRDGLLPSLILTEECSSTNLHISNNLCISECLSIF